MRRRLFRHLTAFVTGLALATGLLTVATVPAQAATFKVSIGASTTVAVVGGKVTFSGKVSPKPSKRTVYLQRRNVGSTSWTTVTKFTVAKSGTYKVTTTLTSDRDRYYRIYKPKSSGRKAGHSRAIQLIVDPAPPSTPSSLLSLSPATSPLSGGTTLTVTGTGLSGTTKVTVTPQVKADYTADGSGAFPELTAGFAASSDSQLEITTPASLAGTNLLKIYTAGGTLTATLTYARTAHDPTSFEKQVLDQVNLRRSSKQTCRGTSMPAVGALTWDDEYADLALSHAKDLSARQGAGYNGLSHTTYGLKEWYHRIYLAGYGGAISEDLALSPAGYSASQVVQQWMSSTSGHCESVMDGEWTKGGIGVASGLWGSQSSIFTNLDLR
jgi:uncharacterized protein YkwD